MRLWSDVKFTRSHAMYERLGVPAAPFQHVQYFAPYKADGRSLNTIRSNAALRHNVTPLTWGLQEVLQFAEVLLNRDDVDAKADALIDFIGENGRTFSPEEGAQILAARPLHPVDVRHVPSIPAGHLHLPQFRRG